MWAIGNNAMACRTVRRISRLAGVTLDLDPWLPIKPTGCPIIEPPALAAIGIMRCINDRTLKTVVSYSGDLSGFPRQPNRQPAPINFEANIVLTNSLFLSRI